MGPLKFHPFLINGLNNIMLFATADKNPIIYPSTIYCIHISLTYFENKLINRNVKDLKFKSISEYINSIVLRFGKINPDSLSCLYNTHAMEAVTGTEKIINCRVSRENMGILEGYMKCLDVSAEQLIRSFLFVASSVDMSVRSKLNTISV